MITFFPSLLVAFVYCSLIKTTRTRRVVQSIIIIIYSLLGAMFV